MFKEDHLSFRQRKYMKVKNIIGRALGGIGLVVLSPVYLAIIVAIKKEDGITAPVFFSQKRVGIHKEYFNLYKFRSMRTDTPHDKPTHLLENPDQYITMEFAFDEDPEFADSILKRVEEVGARPVIAHAERYEFIQDYPQIAYRWFRKGYVIQANKGSFLGRFGGGPKRAADSLLRHNLISVIASDAHSPLQRTPYMLDAYEELSREYSENHLDVLFQYNPARLCDNREILRLEPVPYSGR